MLAVIAGNRNELIQNAVPFRKLTFRMPFTVAATNSSRVAMLTRLIHAPVHYPRGANQMRQRPTLGEQFRRGMRCAHR